MPATSPARTDVTNGAPAPPLAALRHAVLDVTRRDPTRIAIVAGERSLSYGQLAEALPESTGSAERRRNVMACVSPIDDICSLLAAGCRGDSVLVIDGATTRWEADRIRAVFDDGAGGPASPVLGLCTSGTNGLPKVVELDWTSALTNATSFGAAAGYSSEDTLWLTTPLAHLYGLGAGVLAGLMHGGRVVISSGVLGPSEFGDRLLEHEVTVLLSVPFLLHRYVQELEREPALVRSSRLRATIAAGEPVPEDLVARWRAVTSTPLQAHYGLTEGGHVTLASGGAGEGAGRPLADVEVDVSARGAIRLRLRAPAHTPRIVGEPPDPDGWRATGDLGHLDANGNLHITGRTGDRINVAGKKVDPAEVEQALRGCPGVADCAVAAIAGGGVDQIVAFVAGDEGVADTDLRTALGALLSPHKLPRRFVAVPEIPRTLTGKVKRGQLLALLDQEPTTSHDTKGTHQ